MVKEDVPPGADSVVWVVPPACQGQIVERAYSRGCDEDGMVWLRVTDQSVPKGHEDRVTYFRRELVEYEGELETYEPWNNEPGAGEGWQEWQGRR